MPVQSARVSGQSQPRTLLHHPKPRSPKRTAHAPGQGRAKPDRSVGVWVEHIEGRYRVMTVRQLALYWSCFKSNHITYRQLRILFAAAEMLERRAYSKKTESSSSRTRAPRYTLGELKALVGGRGSRSADRALRADLKRLAHLGLLGFQESGVELAASIDEVRIEDTGFAQEMLGRLDHPARPVPVPRRILRAIAGQFPAGVTAVVLATIIRGLFWKKNGAQHASGQGAGQSAYRVDGRTKREWISSVFGVSLRTVTASRQILIDLGWLVPQKSAQWLLNRYGAHDAINTAWKPTNDAAGSASPTDQSAANPATPDQNENSSPTGNLTTNSSAPSRAGPAGVSTGSTRGRGPQGSSSQREHTAKPSIRDIHSADLASTERLLELHKQATRLGLADDSEAGRLAFVALAERARARGRRAGAMFYWLLREGKQAFITQACEDAASSRLRIHRDGQQEHAQRGRGVTPQSGSSGLAASELDSREEDPTPDEQFVQICLQVARQQRIEDPFRIARRKDWTRERWDTACGALEERRLGRMRAIAEAMIDQ